MEKINMYEFRPEVDTTELVLTYQEVFADPPWNEKTICSGCGKYYGLKTSKEQICINCGDILQEAYPYKETRSYLLSDSGREGALILVLRDPKEKFRNLPDYPGGFVGFGLGYPENSTALIAEKYKTSDMQKKLTSILSLNGVLDRLFYISEVGIKKPYRNRGLSNQLVKGLFEQAGKLELPVVMRTNAKSPMVAVAQRFGMQQVLGPKVEVCRGCQRFNISNQAINGLDFENRNRVLFVKN